MEVLVASTSRGRRDVRGDEAVNVRVLCSHAATCGEGRPSVAVLLEFAFWEALEQAPEQAALASDTLDGLQVFDTRCHAPPKVPFIFKNF